MKIPHLPRRSLLAAPVLVVAATMVAKPAMANTTTAPPAPECAADLLARS